MILNTPDLLLHTSIIIMYTGMLYFFSVSESQILVCFDLRSDASAASQF